MRFIDNELLTVIRKNKIMSFSGKGMEVEIIMVKEISQSQFFSCSI